MNDMVLVESRNINNVLVDGFYGDEDVWFTRFQIGSALEYADPQKAILLIHNHHKDRMDKFSRRCQFDTPSGRQVGFLYNTKGVFEICRHSRQPKADAVMDGLYDLAISIMRGKWNRTPCREIEKKTVIPKLKKPEPDWSKVAMLSLNRSAYTRDEYYNRLVEIFDSDRKSIENEMKLYDGLRG